MAKSNGVAANAEFGTPFFGDHFGEPVDACFGETVVGLAGVAVDAGGGGDVDDAAGLAVSDAEEGGSFTDELEGRCIVEREDVVPLFVSHLVDCCVSLVLSKC